MTHEEAHRIAREKGASRPLVAVVRGALTPFFRIWFRLEVSGVENVPAEGPGIIAPNHKSFGDAFFIAAAVKRPVRFMGKSELFEGSRGRLWLRLGAFPVKRGESDQDALETARAVLRQGELFAAFPEGTRIRDPEALGPPRRGVARLALETGSPLIPAAITGTENLLIGPFLKPKKVRISFTEPIEVREVEPTPDAAAELVDEQLWPEVEGEFTRLVAQPTLIAATLAAVGIGTGIAVSRRRRAGRRGGLRRDRSRSGRR